MVARNEHLHIHHRMPVVAYFAAQPPTNKAFPKKSADRVHVKSVFHMLGPFGLDQWPHRSDAPSPPLGHYRPQSSLGIIKVAGIKCIFCVLAVPAQPLALRSTCLRK